MFTLALMRHARSDWQYDLPDIDRPLNKRGRRDALAMGKHLRQINALPDRLLVSPAQRTRETAERLLQSTEQKPEIIVDNELYLASRETLLELAEAYAIPDQRLMLLAHNPGMDDAVSFLANKPPPLSSTGKLMATCAVALFEYNATSDLHRPNRCRLTALIRPEDID